MDETKPKLNWKRLLITLGIVLVTAAAVGGTVWYIMDQNAKSLAGSTKKQNEAMQKQIDELKTAQNSSDSETNKTTPNTQVSPNLMKVPELGLEFTLPSSLSDAYYFTTKEGGTTTVGFTTKTLVEKGGSDCSGGIGKPVWAPLGSINLSSTPPPNGVGDITTGGFIKQINGKYLYYRSAQAACSPTLSQEAANAQTGDMLRTALSQTVTAI